MTQSDPLQQFIDSANAAIYLKDEEGRFLMVNRRVAEMFKASKEDIIGKLDSDFATREDADKFRAYDQQVREAGTPMSFKATISLADGNHTVIDHKFPVSDIEGAPHAVGGIAIEVTSSE